MKPANGSIIKLIGLILTGIVMVGGAVASGYKIKEDAKDYTDQSVKELRIEQRADIKEIQENIVSLNQNMTIIRTIIEERFGRARANRNDQ